MLYVRAAQRRLEESEGKGNTEYMYIIVAIALFGFLIAAHEWGHFMAARICGVTVHEFAIGMGPVLWQREGGKGTVFSLRALPIGGFCAMEGEEEESDDPHSLSNQGFWKKLLVFAAGALMNLLVGFALILLLNMGVEAFRTAEITAFAPEFTLRGEEGLLEGDVLYSINGHRIYIFSDVNLFLSRSGGSGFDLVVLRNGEKIVLDDFPMVLQECTDSQSGQKYTGYGLYFGGVEEATAGVKLRMTWLNGVDFVRIVFYSLGEILRGSAGMNDLSGPIGIVSTISQVGQESPTVMAGLMNVAYFGAMIAMNLAVFNLLPIPALDGGHICFLAVSTLWEKVSGRKIPMRYETAINGLFFVLLLSLMAFVALNDVRKLIG